MFDKLKQNLANASDGALQAQIGSIKELIKKQAGDKMNELSQDEQKLRGVLKNVYTVLPGAVRLAVKEDKFVDFCVAHKDEVLTRLN